MSSRKFGVEQFCFARLFHGLLILPPVIEGPYDFRVVGQQERIQSLRLGYLPESILMSADRAQIRRIPAVRCGITGIEGNGFLEHYFGVLPVPHMHPEMSEGKACIGEFAIQLHSPLSSDSRLGPPFLGRNHIRDDKEGVGIRKSGIGRGKLGVCRDGLIKIGSGLAETVFRELVPKISTSSVGLVCCW